MAQTPQQRRANEKFARHEAAKRGKAQAPAPKPRHPAKSPLSAGWVVLLAFVVCGGLIFELLRIVPEIWSVIAGFFGRLLG